MTRRPSFVEIALVAGAILILGVAGFVAEEHRQAAVDTYSSYDARSGGYQAWYELLEREGVNVSRFERAAAFLDGSIGTLIVSLPLPFDKNVIAPTEIDRVAIDDWIARGGTIVSLGPFDLQPHSPLAQVRFRVLSQARLQAMGVRSVSSRLRPIVREGTYKRGAIYLVQDEAVFSNKEIATADNARLAYALTRLHGGGNVAFYETIHGYFVPEHWWLVAPPRLVYAIVAATLVVALALIGGAIRLGPPLVVSRRREATSLEYVDAVASLYARGHAVRQALSDALRSVKRTVATALALPDDLPTRELARHILIPDLRGALAELDVLATMPLPDERHLVRGANLAHLLRKEYQTHGRGF
jgi:hypothetical protein